MTLFVFLGAKLLRQGDRPAAGVVWTGMVLATLLFGVVHLPQAAALGVACPPLWWRPYCWATASEG